MPVAEASRLAERISGARVAILEGADHACYLDRPAEFHSLLASFVGEVLP
jgi:pimeloyl-ACP methyl ester carboxylesterase